MTEFFPRRCNQTTSSRTRVRSTTRRTSLSWCALPSTLSGTAEEADLRTIRRRLPQWGLVGTPPSTQPRLLISGTCLGGLCPRLHPVKHYQRSLTSTRPTTRDRVLDSSPFRKIKRRSARISERVGASMRPSWAASKIRCRAARASSATCPDGELSDY